MGVFDSWTNYRWLNGGYERHASIKNELQFLSIIVDTKFKDVNDILKDIDSKREIKMFKRWLTLVSR